MKAITVRQPWAEMIVQGKKREEYRTWPTRHRGRLAIHAGCHRSAYSDPDLAYGAIIGTVDIIDCVEVEPGLYAWRLANPRRLRRPVPMKGRLGLWTWESPDAD